MPTQKSIPISELITTANSELLRLDFKRSALQIYCAEFRKFSDYYSNEKIQDYTATTGREYFQSIYGVNIASPRLQLTKSQSATRRAIRLLDDIFQFGYALRYCHRSYTVNPEYDILLESYLMKCRKKHNSQGTLRTKQMKLCQFFEYEGGKSMEMNSVMATEIVAAEVEHIVLPQIVSIKQASRMLGLPPYYLRRLCKEVPGVAFQSGIKWYINLGKLVDYYNNSGRNAAG